MCIFRGSAIVSAGNVPERPAIPEPLLIGAALATIFTASMVHGGFGFGTALVAMPLLTLLFGLNVASPLIAMIVSTTVVIVFVRERQHFAFADVWPLLLAGLLGLPLGVMLIKFGPAQAVRQLLGVVLIGFALYNLTRPRLPPAGDTRWAWPCGFVSGVLGGAFNINGPPVVLYGALRGWSPARFRANLQAYFLPSALAILSVHGFSGLWSKTVFALYAVLLPAALLGNLAGHWLGRRIPVARFQRLLYGLLIVLGAVMLV